MTDDASRDGGKGDRRRRIDGTAALVALAAIVALSWIGWRRLGPGPAAEPPGIGAVPPPLRLLDADTGEPLVLLGLKGKVVWVAFWSAASTSGRSDLSALGRMWDRLKARRRFAMVAVAVDGDPPDRLREALAASRSRPPTYRATPETRRAFGATGRDLPIHLLIDETGRVAAVARGGGADTLGRLADQAERRLDELEPFDATRFARSGGADPGPSAISAGSLPRYRFGQPGLPLRPPSRRRPCCCTPVPPRLPPFLVPPEAQSSGRGLRREYFPGDRNDVEPVRSGCFRISHQYSSRASSSISTVIG